MSRKISTFLTGLFYAVFGLIFLSLVLRLIFSGDAPAFAPLAVTAVLVLMAVVYRVLKKCTAYLEQNYSILLGGFVILYLLTEIALSHLLEYTPWGDLHNIYDGAIEWAQTGSFGSVANYFYLYPNNLGETAVLAGLFRLTSSLGLTDYFMTASVATGLCATAAILVTATICRKLLGTPQAVFVLILFTSVLPFWLIAPTFYTDSASVLFPALILYLYLKVDESDTRGKQILFAVLLGLAAALGAIIKVTILIMVVAVVIDSLLRRPLIQTAVLTSISAVLICAGLLCLRAVIYSEQLDADKAAQFNFPYLHWVMMGLNGDGTYNYDDVEFTHSLSADTDQRDNVLTEEIVRRVRELGPIGLYKLFWTKSMRLFGTATYEQAYFLGQTPIRQTYLHRYLLYDGEEYPHYQALCEVIWIAILALMTVSSLWKAVRWHAERAQVDSEPTRLSDDAWNFPAPQMAVFGALLFFTAWESSGRHITNYIPVILICAATGAECWERMVARALEFICGRRRHQNSLQPHAGDVGTGLERDADLRPHKLRALNMR